MVGDFFHCQVVIPELAITTAPRILTQLFVLSLSYKQRHHFENEPFETKVKVISFNPEFGQASLENDCIKISPSTGVDFSKGLSLCVRVIFKVC